MNQSERSRKGRSDWFSRKKREKPIRERDTKMTKYIMKRIGMALLTLLIITFLLFLLVRIMPGNPFLRLMKT